MPENAIVNRATPVISALLLGSLAVFGLVADQALRSQVVGARASVASRAVEEGRLTALSVRATLAQIRAGSGGRSER